MTNSEIKKPCLNCSEPTDNVYLNGVSLCGKCVIALINSRTPEPTKAENGLVPLNIDKVANAIRVFDGNHDKGAGQIAEHICKTFATPSITKEQLLAILPELTKEYFKKDITHADEMLADIQAMSMEIGHLRTNAIMKQRIEELGK